MKQDLEAVVADTGSACRSLLWRIHFWSALVASPFILAAALTGILYVFVPQIEAVMYDHLDRVEPERARLPLDESVRVARSAVPEGWELYLVIPPVRAEDSARVVFMPRAPAPLQTAAAHSVHAGHGAPEAQPQPRISTGSPAFLRSVFGPPARSLVVYVDPYRARVLGSLPHADRFVVWAKKLHSTYLRDGWRWVIELAASWALVMLVTGLFLWWPAAGEPVLPRAGARGRPAWRQWHAFIGVALGAMSAIMLVTGLTWSKNAGEQVRWVRDAVGQTPPRIPAGLKSEVPAQGQVMTWQQAADASRRVAPDVAMQLFAPKGPEGYWRAADLDRGNATKRFDVVLDAYTGKPLHYLGWDQQTLFSKATAIGIPFHRGEFGLWNQALLLVFGAGMVFSMVTGWVMVLKRRRMGVPLLPAVAPGAWRRVSILGWACAVVMCAAMPLLALSAALVALVEVVLYLRSRTGGDALMAGG